MGKMNLTASNNYDLYKKYEGETKEVAFNPVRKLWETVYPDDEVPEGGRIKMYWLDSLRRYVTIPED